MSAHVLIKNGAQSRQLAVVLRALLAREIFSDPTTLREVFEARARALGLSTRRHHIEAALDMVGSNRPLLTSAPPSRTASTVTSAYVPSRDEARQILARYGIDLRGESS
jgi:hypothetical protein